MHQLLTATSRITRSTRYNNSRTLGYVLLASVVFLILNVVDYHQKSVKNLSLLRQLGEEFPNARNLVVVDAVGRTEVLGSTLHNVKEHFSGPEWACLIFVYVKEDKIPEEDPNLVQIKDYCTIIRIPEINWGNWLQILPPALIGQYDRIAILLDDIFLPSTGSTKISVPELLEKMDEFDLSSISPAISGAGNHLSTHPKTGPIAKCVAQVEMTEVYFQIFTKDAWSCFYSQLEHSNGGGYCYDKCYAAHCGGVNAIDYRMVAYHLERAWYLIPADAKSKGLSFLPTKPMEHAGKDGNELLCKKNNCSQRFDKWQTLQLPIVCDDSQEELDEKKIMHTFSHPDIDDKSLLQVWSNSWIDAGWEIKILTLDDVKKNPDYKEVNKLLSLSKLDDRSKLAILHYLAMPTAGGGWYSAHSVLPLHPREEGSSLPNNGLFTNHEGKRFGLLSASKEEWNRIIRFIVERRQKSPLVALEEVHDQYPHAYHYENIVHLASYKDLFNTAQCEEMKNKLAVRIQEGTYLSDSGQKASEDKSSLSKSWMKMFEDQCQTQI